MTKETIQILAKGLAGKSCPQKLCPDGIDCDECWVLALTKSEATKGLK